MKKPSRRRQSDEPRDREVYDGRQCLGRVVWLGDDWRAEDAEGHSLGVFTSRAEAREAISEARRAA